MKHATIVKIQVLALAAVMASSSTAILAQRSKQAKAVPTQTAPDPSQAQAAPDPTQAQAAPTAAQNSVCGNQARCYETTDFAATITQFRVSVDAWQNKVLDVMMHFQNKTNQLLSLGYVDGSASGLDDRGNRFGMNTANGGVRGIGIVAGNNMDPKFTLQPGGSGDARFELYWPPRGQIAGVQYEVELSIREINRVEGNQWMLGNESLLHYDGLTNGAGVAGASGSVGMGSAFSGNAATAPAGVGTVPANAANTSGGMARVSSLTSAFVPNQATASASPTQPCPPGTAAAPSKLASVANTAGQQNATANNAVTNATSAISSLGSLFGHKKPAAAPATTTASATPCVAATNTAVNPLATPAPVANAATRQPVATTVPATSSVATRAAVIQQKPSPLARAAAQQTPPPVAKASLKQPVASATPAATPARTPTSPTTAAPAKKKPATTTVPAPATSGGGLQ